MEEDYYVDFNGNYKKYQHSNSNNPAGRMLVSQQDKINYLEKELDKANEQIYDLHCILDREALTEYIKENATTLREEAILSLRVDLEEEVWDSLKSELYPLVKEDVTKECRAEIYADARAHVFKQLEEARDKI